MEFFENGSKTKEGKISVLNLYGTWREMGRQYGALMADELADIYKNAVCDVLLTDETKKANGTETAEKLFANYPYRFKQILVGMSETSGLGLSELKLVNAMEVIASVLLYKHQMCSGIAAWGDYAESSLVYGRNYDYLTWFKKFADDLVVSVFHPADLSLASATVGYAGEIYAANGMNEKGIFIELNNGFPSGGALWYDSRIPAVVKLFEFLFDCESLDEIEAAFQTTRANFAYIAGVADTQTARCFEWPTFDVKRRITRSRPGLTVLTNHFTEFSWGLPRPEDSSFYMTRSRRQNLLNLAKHFKGTINEKVMMNIMDTRYENLGATTDMTLYQIVAVPEKSAIWIKLPQYQEWTYIDLGRLFSGRKE
ncbi:MAG: C45 family peptidase [Synergistes sp.]|nr:C45 family peptidase [Synergistes sp.]